MDTKGHGKHKHTQCQQCFTPKRSDKLDKTTGCCKGSSCKPSPASKSVFNFPLGAHSLLGKRVQPPADNKSLKQQVEDDDFGGLVPDAIIDGDEPQPQPQLSKQSLSALGQA